MHDHMFIIIPVCASRRWLSHPDPEQFNGSSYLIYRGFRGEPFRQVGQTKTLKRAWKSVDRLMLNLLRYDNERYAAAAAIVNASQALTYVKPNINSPHRNEVEFTKVMPADTFKYI